MFRELLRKNKALSQEECIQVLKKETRGVLSVLGDNDYPYGMPMNHYYNEEDGNLYFHCGKTGHRLDALRKHNKVSFCAFDSGERKDGEWALHVKSVVVFGRIEFVEDEAVLADIVTRLSRKFTQDEEYIRNEIALYGHKTLLMRLRAEHICGKEVMES